MVTSFSGWPPASWIFPVIAAPAQKACAIGKINAIAIMVKRFGDTATPKKSQYSNLRSRYLLAEGYFFGCGLALPPSRLSISAMSPFPSKMSRVTRPYSQSFLMVPPASIMNNCGKLRFWVST